MSDAPAAKESPAAGAAVPAHPAPAGKSPIVGIALGALVLIGLGVGGGMFLMSLLKPVGDGKEAASAEHAAAEGHGHGDGIDLHSVVELSLGDLITNITNSDGRRFVKVTCVLWVDPLDAAAIGDGAGGGDHAGSGVQVRRLVQMALEEQLKRYELADFTSRGAISTVSSDFLVVIENVLRQHVHDRPKDHRFVKKVILNSLLVQ
jgi:hypothetical protein